MKIDYNNYKVFNYTLGFLKTHYTIDILKKYGKVIAFLFQNGYTLSVKDLAEADEQMWLFNNFATYEDFEEFEKLFKNYAPTKYGKKIVAEEVGNYLTKYSWANKQYENLKGFGEVYWDSLKQGVLELEQLVNCPDLEVHGIFENQTKLIEAIQTCSNFIEQNKVVRAFVNFLNLYKEVKDLRISLNKDLMTTSEQGKLQKVEKLMEELYGSGGGCNKNDLRIIAKYGSAVDDLRRLQNDSDAEAEGLILRLCQESIEFGETDKVIVDFANRKNRDFKKVRKALSEVVFNGIVSLVSIKNGLKLVGEPKKETVSLIEKELEAICKFCNYRSDSFVC